MILASTLTGGSIYDFKVTSLDGSDIDFSKYKGKKIMIVNTASECGNTPQYAELEKLYEKYQDKLVIVGFPANNFGAQEPGTEAEIASFCDTKYHVTFPMFSKVDVNGGNAHPLYRYLTSDKPGVLGTEAIKWNFTKFLVNRQGDVVRRYGSSDAPERIERDLEPLLRSGATL